MTASKRISCALVCLWLMLSCIICVSAEEASKPLTYGEFSYEISADGTVCVTAYNGEGGEVTIPSQIEGKAVTTLGDELFWYKEEVTAVKLPDTLEYIGARVFQSCTSLKAISLPDSVAEIGDACFLGCSNLAEINVPSHLVYAGAFAFDETPWVTQFDGCSSIILGGRVFYKYVADEDKVVVPDGVVCLSDNAFEGKSLSFVSIPDTVAFVGDYCFYNCKNLKEIKLPANIYYLGENSLGVLAGASDVEFTEGFTIYASEGSAGADYAKAYEVMLKNTAEFTEPQSLPAAEKCVPTAEIREADKAAATMGLSQGAVITIILTIVGLVVIIGGVTVGSHIYEKKRKKGIKDKQNSVKKKK